LIADKLVGHIVPVRFAFFALIGGLDVFVHFAVLWHCFKVAALTFDYSQSIATIAAMTSNFFLNNFSRIVICGFEGGACCAVCYLSTASAWLARSLTSGLPHTFLQLIRNGGLLDWWE